MAQLSPGALTAFTPGGWGESAGLSGPDNSMHIKTPLEMMKLHFE